VEAWRASIEELRAATSEVDREAWLASTSEFWDQDIELDVSEVPGMGMSGIYLGREAVQELWRDWFRGWEALSYDYQLVEAGERVVMLMEWSPRKRRSGAEPPVLKNALVSTFKNGLMVHSKFYMSHGEALEAAGLSE
jgi:hypothetical protein